VAVGSHQPPVRKLDSQLVGRAVVVVEDVRTALSEAGDVVLAIAEGQLRDDELIPMARAAYTHTLVRRPIWNPAGEAS
jgi:ornithine cyclodeaminase/alanine dehydrogenase-like protein (mu-crystallin family)